MGFEPDLAQPDTKWSVVLGDLRAEARFQPGTPQDPRSGNFVPKRDLTRYCNGTRDCSWNRTTVCQPLCWLASHHSVRV